jgi:hypothetical protein
MGTLRSLYQRIPTRWKLWILSFLLGLLITLIWGVGVLLFILLALFIVSYFLFSIVGSRKVREVGQWSITQYFKRVRGVILFALLPTAWELIRNPSLDSIIALVVLLFVALSIWDKFDEIMSDFTKGIFGTRRRRR